MIRSARVRVLTLIALATTGCGGSGTSPLEVDAGVEATAASAHDLHGALSKPTAHAGGTIYRDVATAIPEHPILAGARKILAMDSKAAHLLDEHTRGLTLTEEGFLTKSRVQPPKGGDLSHMSAIVPHRADDVTFLSAGGVERWGMTLTPEGRASVTGALDGGRVIYADALPHADVIVTGDERWIEELYVLRDREAPSTLRWHLKIGAGLTPKEQPLSDGSIDFIDAKGDAALRIHRPFAIDAKGTRIDASLTLDGDALTVALDTSNLAFPVVLDPVVEVPIWQNISSGPYLASNGGAMAWNPITSQTTMIGGSNGSSYLADAYTWNGATWTGMGFPAVSQIIQPAFSDWGSAAWGGIVSYGGKTTAGVASSTAYMNNGSWFTLCSPCTETVSAGTSYFYLPTTTSDPVKTSTGSTVTLTMPPMAGAVAANYGPKLVMLGTDRNTYAFEFGSAYWVLFPLTSAAADSTPSPRINACMAGDSAGHAVLVGGQPMSKNAPDPSGADLTDAWSFDSSAAVPWKPLCGIAPLGGCPFARRKLCSMTYDSARRKFYLTGGNLEGASAGAGDANDLWEYDYGANAWTALLPLYNPTAPAREAAAFSFDRGRGRAVLAGGFLGTRMNENWELHVRGGSCSTNADCDTGHCIEGTCCESVCATCQTCADPTSPGVCKNVAAGVSDPLARCASGGQCDGAGACRPALGSSCTAGTGCASGFCVNSTCCATSSCGGGLTCADAAGTCKKVSGQSCVVGTECATGNCVDGVCCGSASCGAGARCNYPSNLGTCLKIEGQACPGGASTCGSGNCVDGYCCSSACTSQCGACDVPGLLGACVAVNGAPHGTRAACAGSGACGSVCNGSDVSVCHYPGSSVACGSATCAAGIASAIGQCDGSGICAQVTTGCDPYTCGPTACKTTCSTDAECASGSFCSGTKCAPKIPLGDTCATDGGCLSGHCAGGICCDSACTATGFSCGLSTSRGHCAKANGVACSASSECGSGFCTDGVCCDTACGGQCQACDAGGSAGTCTAVKGAPHGARSACSGTGAGTTCGPTCDGVKTSACTYPDPAVRCGADTCTDASSSSSATHVGACNSAGSCSTSASDCGTYKCSGTVCRTSCTAKSDCQAGFYCDGGACVPIIGLGSSCTTAATCASGFCTDGVCCGVATCGAGGSCSAGTPKGVCKSVAGTTCSSAGECASGQCVDGVCCDAACDGSCEACNVGGSVGKCVPIVGQPLVGHPACSATPTDLECGLRCDGTDAKACHDAPSTTACGKPSCSGGVETEVSTCDGGGACKPLTRACGAYGCGPTACRTSCAIDGDCGTGSFCKAGACTATQLLGESCTNDTQCQSSHCADGVCCSVASCGASAACAGLGDHAGSCLKKLGATCGGAGECASGHCVDGLCCDKACDGQCEACEVKGSEGTCTPVTGAPHGTRTTCDTLSASDCAKKTCDGAVRDKCAGFVNGTTTPCGKASCTPDKKLQKIGACDGKGACSLPEATSCVEYACDPTKTSCRADCDTDDDCSPDFVCEKDSHKCVQGAHCSADRLQSIDKTGVATSCTPYNCGTDGKCEKLCSTSEDCVAGTVCEIETRACIVLASSPDSGGGCGCEVPGASSTSEGGGRGSLASLVAAALATLVGMRRRRGGARIFTTRAG